MGKRCKNVGVADGETQTTAIDIAQQNSEVMVSPGGGGIAKGGGVWHVAMDLLFSSAAEGGGLWHKASVSDCLPLAAPIGLSPLLILALCGPERVLVVSTEPLDDLSCLTTPGVGCPGDGLLPVPLTRWGEIAEGGGGGRSRRRRADDAREHSGGEEEEEAGSKRRRRTSALFYCCCCYFL